ncbi:MAG TPA: hypothetical protein VEG60_00100 [Candidatus Binatia bacterium]|nr:hypothetical protein [Candidatus Binatia bacterium]
MTQCLDRKTLFLLSQGEASEKERFHLQNCEACAKCYDKIEQDLQLITRTLQQEPPPVGFASPERSILLRSLPVAAGVLLALALMWGESRLWRADSAPDQRLSSDVSQFLEQVSEAIFDGRRVREVGIAASDSDLASVQVALGEDCSAECRSLFNDWPTPQTKSPEAVNRPIIAIKRQPPIEGMQQMVSGRAK